MPREAILQPPGDDVAKNQALLKLPQGHGMDTEGTVEPRSQGEDKRKPVLPVWLKPTVTAHLQVI